MGLLVTVNQMFSKSTVQDCDCIEGEVSGRSQIAAVLEEQAVLKWEVDDLTVLLASKEI